MRNFLYPGFIVETMQGSSRSSWTEEVDSFHGQTFSSVAKDNGDIFPMKLQSLMTSNGFDVNLGNDTRIRGGRSLNSLILQLYSTVNDASFYSVISIKVINVCFIRDCVSLTSSKCLFKMSLCFTFMPHISFFILFTTLSISLCNSFP